MIEHDIADVVEIIHLHFPHALLLGGGPQLRKSIIPLAAVNIWLAALAVSAVGDAGGQDESAPIQAAPFKQHHIALVERIGHHPQTGAAAPGLFRGKTVVLVVAFIGNVVGFSCFRRLHRIRHSQDLLPPLFRLLIIGAVLRIIQKRRIKAHGKIRFFRLLLLRRLLFPAAGKQARRQQQRRHDRRFPMDPSHTIPPVSIGSAAGSRLQILHLLIGDRHQLVLHQISLKALIRQTV